MGMSLHDVLLLDPDTYPYLYSRQCSVDIDQWAVTYDSLRFRIIDGGNNEASPKLLRQHKLIAIR